MSDNIYLELELFLDPAVTDVAALKEELDKKILEWNKLFAADAKYKHFVQVAKAWQRSPEKYDLVQLAREARSIREKHGHDAAAVYEEDGILEQQEYDDLHKEFAAFFEKSTIDSWLHLKVTDSFVPQEPQYPPEVKKKIISKNDMDKIAVELKIVLGDDKVSLYDLIGVSPKSNLSTVQEKSNTAYNIAFKKPKTGLDSAKVDAELRLLGRAKTIFGDDASRQGYDIAVKRRPFDQLIDTKFKRRAAKGGITYDDYKRSIDDALKAGYSKTEAEWYVYEYFCKTRKFVLPKPTEQPTHTKPIDHQTDKRTEPTQQVQPQINKKTEPTQQSYQPRPKTVIKKKPDVNIFDAIKQGDLKAVHECINADPKSVYEKDVILGTPLHLAVSCHDNVAIIKCLLENCAEVNARAGDGTTPLHWAAMYNDNEYDNVEIIKCLIENGAEINTKSNSGHTPLDVANTIGKKYILRKFGATVNKKKLKYNIYTAIKKGDMKAVKQWINIKKENLLRNFAVPVDRKNPKCNIRTAIKRGDLETVKQWLNIDPKLISRVSDWFIPLIIYAASSAPNADIIECLIENGADVLMISKNGANTPLHIAACWNPNVDVIKKLLENGAYMNAINSYRVTPLHYAVINNPNVDVIKYLIENGADVYAKNTGDITPLDMIGRGVYLRWIVIFFYHYRYGIFLDAANRQLIRRSDFRSNFRGDWRGDCREQKIFED